VLGRHNLGEADRIVTFFTTDRGKLRAVARGVRKIGSRQAGHIEPFSRVDLMLAEGRNLDIVTSARLQAYPVALTSDFERVGQAYLVAHMVDRLTDDGAAAPGIYRLLDYTLSRLEAQGASAVLELFFKLRLLGQLGYRPQLEVCGNCGRQLEEGYISPEYGGLVCASCRLAADPELTAQQLGLWRNLLSAKYESEIGEPKAVASLEICDTFYEYFFGRRFAAQTKSSL
jgi:DNA repair protein RecO (recombination protein O)